MNLRYELMTKFCDEKDMQFDELLALITTKIEWLDQFRPIEDIADEMINILV